MSSGKMKDKEEEVVWEEELVVLTANLVQTSPAKVKAYAFDSMLVHVCDVIC